MVSIDQVSAIREKAEILAGHALEDSGDRLAEMAAETAMAWCGRDDIPPEMEASVAALAISLAAGDEVVKSLTRGDTSITYETGTGAMAALTALAPWRRLSRLKEDPL